jgi:hypothetical protein
VRRRDVIRPIINITTPAATAAGVEGGSSNRSAMVGVQLLPSAMDSRNDSDEKSTLAKIVLSVYRSSLLQDALQDTAVFSKVEDEIKEATTSRVTPSPRDQQQLQKRPAVPSTTGRDPDEIVRGKLRSKLLTKKIGRLDNNIDGNDSNNQISTTTAAGAEDPPGEEPSIFPIVKLDIIGTPAAAVAIPSAASSARVVRQRRQRDAEPSMIDNARLFESSIISLGTSSEISLDLSKDDTFNCSSSSNSNNNNNSRRTRSIISSNHHRNSNINVVRWVDTKNINNIAQVDINVLQRYANLFVNMATQHHHPEQEEEKKNNVLYDDENYYPTLATAIRGIDPDEDIFVSSSSTTTTTTIDHHHQQEHNTYTTNTNYNNNNNNNIVNDDDKEKVVLQGRITNSRIRIATISCGFKRSNYFVREDLDTRIYFSTIEDAVGYMSIRGYCKMMGNEELEWRELFRRAHGVVKVCAVVE